MVRFTTLIECIILTGCGNGKTVLIPRISIISSDLPFKFKRIQFPVKLAFAMTINKAQGQRLNVAGIDLSVQCFSHGQYIYKVDNVVYKEIF